MKVCVFCLGWYDGGDERSRRNSRTKWVTGMLFLHGSISAVIQDVFFVSYKVVVCRHKDRVAGLFYHFSLFL